MITDLLLTPILKEQTALIKLLKKLLPQTMPMENMTIYVRSNRVFVSVENAMVAQQWMFLKKTILEKLQEKIPTLKEIRIQIEPQESLQKHENNNQPCHRCGSALLRQGENLCSLCLSENLNVDRQRVFQFLREAPWIRYQDLEEKDKKLIDYEAFMRERTFQIKRIYDKIDLEYWAWHRMKDTRHLNQFKTNIEEYVITKQNIHPQNLNNEIIKANVSARWYKLYISQSE
jgi:hypothetical protein